jgi:hypothetical protein
MRGVDGVACPRPVQVPGAIGLQPVPGEVVEPAEAQRRPEVVAFGGVVVDHVDDDLDPGEMQRPHHRLELVDRVVGGGVLVVRCEESDAVVTPVVAASGLEEVLVLDELVDGEQFHRGDAEGHEMFEHGVVGQAGVGAA